MFLDAYRRYQADVAEKKELEERSPVANQFIEEFISLLRTQAPNFKYVYIGANNTGGVSRYSSHTIHIIDANGTNLEYQYAAHKFSVSDRTRKQLAYEIARRFGGKWFITKADISDDRHPLMVEVGYYVVAHDGLKEPQNVDNGIRYC